MPEPKKIERWVSVLAEEIGCSCRHSEEIAWRIQEAVDAQKKLRKSGGRRTTWLSPYDDIYSEVMGGDHPDLGPLMKPAGRVEELMRSDEDGEAAGESAAERAYQSFRNFCWAHRDKREYINWTKWADNARYWYGQTRQARIPL